MGGGATYSPLSLRMAFLNVISVWVKAEFNVQCDSKVSETVHSFHCLVADESSAVVTGCLPSFFKLTRFIRTFRQLISVI